MRRPLLLLGLAAACAGAALVGGRATTRGRDTWYRTLNKPRWNPPDWVFGPVWTTLYGLMTASAYRIGTRAPTGGRRRALALWGTQLGLNAAWSPLFFAAHRPLSALADLGLLVGAIAAYTNEARKHDRPAAWMMAPYLGWTVFAGALNAALVAKNAPAALR